MEIVYIGDQNPSNRALLISGGEWKRLGKILTKKSDEKDAVVASQRLKDKRRQTSKKMVDGWDNTELNKTKKLLEQKRKALAELETKQQQRDEEMKREALETRNRIIEKARCLKFEERDIAKTFNRALQHFETFRERAIQLKFNEDKRRKKMEKDLATAQEQNRQAEQYEKERMNEWLKNNELKRITANLLLKELKDREEQRRDKEVALDDSGKAELLKIAEEIKEAQEKAYAEAQAAREKLQKDITDNRELIAKNDEMRRTEEMEEEMVIAIMAETKKNLARARRLKEQELTKVKQMALEEMRAKVAAWPSKKNGWAESDVLNAVEAQEKRYRDGRQERKLQANQKTEFVETGKKIWEKEMAERQERLVLERQQDMERRAREKELIAEFAELRNRSLMEKANKFRKQLDKQCNDKTAAFLADRQADVDRYNELEQQWRNEDQEFMAYAENIIAKKKLNRYPIRPLLKTVNDYLVKNNLYVDQDNKVLKKVAKGPVYTSRIIHKTD